MNKELTSNQKEKLVIEIIEYLQKHELFFMVNIWANNKVFTDDDKGNYTEKSTKYGKYYIKENSIPSIEYQNKDTITMTFEGPLYHAINYESGKTEEDLNEIFKKYGLYFELGYAWSLAAYYI